MKGLFLRPPIYIYDTTGTKRVAPKCTDFNVKFRKNFGDNAPNFSSG